MLLDFVNDEATEDTPNVSNEREQRKQTKIHNYLYENKVTIAVVMEEEWNEAKLDALWPQVIYQGKNIFFKVLSEMII